jgi:photosystem II stability/assembly factor-like uncharacterized protein
MLTLRTLCAAALLPLAVAAQDDRQFLRERVLGRMPWRSVGPANFGGRIVDLAVDPRNPWVWYAATGSGGLWKTENNGTTFKPVFEKEKSYSIGDVAIAPSNGDVLYVGTGEANNQRSSYWGDGVYKSEDAGKTFKHVGLAGSEHIGRIAVHPTNPDVVFVAALGALYTTNPERGLYRTLDGGKTWQCVHRVSDRAGFVDVVIDPKEPKNVYAASYERIRRAHHVTESGPGSAIWKSSDGGDRWTRLAGGLPNGEIGRIGLDVFPANPQVLVATVENKNPAPAQAETRTEGQDNRTPRAPDSGAEPEPAQDPQPARRRLVGGEVWRTDDAGHTWRKINKTDVGGSPGYYYGQIRIDPKDDQTIYVLSVPVHVTNDGGQNWRQDFARGVHVDHHALWIDPQNNRRALLGNDGGIHQTFDHGRTWDHIATLPIGQVYAIGVDLRQPYRIYCGLQDNGTWGIPSEPLDSGGLTRNDAYRIGGGDGFYVVVDPTDDDVVYCESQFGGMTRQNLRTGQSASIKPRAERGQPALRFNWMTPIVLSPHDPQTVYTGTQYVHRSRNRGDRWETISPDLTTNDADKLKGNVPHCTITTISESPRREGLIWAGTDDGRVWVTRNAGGRWTDVSDRVPGLPKPLWVSRVETSPSEAEVCYVAFTGYREDIKKPFLYVTKDGGETFTPIVNGLPDSPINVVREHPRNSQVLFAGTEHGVQVSIDAGGTWHPLGKSPPTVAVHDLLVHPRQKDLVLGTHGRGLYVIDITALEECNAETFGRPFQVFAARDGRLLRRAFGGGYGGARRWTADNTEQGAVFHYFLSQDADAPVTVKVMDATGKVLLNRSGAKEAGLHTLAWNPRGGQGGRQGGGGPGGGGPQGLFGGRGGGASAGPGQYVVEIAHGDQVERRPFWIHAGPGVVATAGGGDDEGR